MGEAQYENVGFLISRSISVTSFESLNGRTVKRITTVKDGVCMRAMLALIKLSMMIGSCVEQSVVPVQDGISQFGKLS